MLISAGAFTSLIQAYRMVWISGKVGGHKTSLAYKLAEPFLQQGYKLVTNNACVWADDEKKIELDKNNHLKTVVIFDEGGLYFDESSKVKMIASYPAKMDVIFIFPSFWPPNRSAQILTCQPLFGLKSAGLPLIIYRWRVRIGGFSDSGIFFWWYPQEIYGIYSRQDPGDRAENIISWLVSKTEDYRKRYGRAGENTVSTVEEGSTDFSKLDDAVSVFADAVDTLSTLPKRGRFRR